MRICSFGDVHGNLSALRAVLDAVAREDPDLVVCTGDVVFGWGEPEACADAVWALGCPWVTGNAEQALLDAPEHRPPAGSAAAVRAAWERGRLGPARLRRLAALPAGLALHLRDAGTVRAAHGCPPARITPGVRAAGQAEAGDNVASDDDVRAWLGEDPPGLFLCGHTHVPTVRRLGPTWAVNPGSVGYGIHPDAPERYQTGNAWARFAVADWCAERGWSASVRRVAYDVDEAVRALARAPWADADEIGRRLAFLRRPAVPGPDPVP